MPRISLPVERLQSHYTVVVIGSGYGGAIAASRMARAGQTVCVLERGRELQPGEYPDTLEEALREMQTDAPEAHLGPASGLFDFRVNKDISVVLGCGLGGTSLVNANVGLRPEDRVLQDSAWPEAFRNDTTMLNESFQHAEEVLQPQPVPDSLGPIAKMQAHAKSAQAMGAKWYRTPLYVTFEKPANGVNAFGVPQDACIGCGDCVSGCNFHAKNTTLMNYLPDAANFGAEIFTEASVRYLERSGAGWLVHYQPIGVGREKFNAPDMFVRADIVILGAGTLGSTEILLRSAEKGLSLSSKIGHNFSGNGDILGFAYNTDTRINGVGFGTHSPKGRDVVGPCITSVIDLRGRPNVNDGMIIEEGSIPGAIGSLMPVALSAAGALSGNHPSGLQEALAMKKREIESLIGGPYAGAVRNTQTYLVMGNDDGSGQMLLENDRLRISYPSAGTEPNAIQGNQRLKQAAQPLGGVFAPNPTWHTLQSKSLVTVHPLGGCIMADDAAHGVVNHKGQVFRGSAGTEVYSNLYVDDGAVIPRPLAVNPSLMISAIAERTCALIAKDRGWTIDYSLTARPRVTSGVTTPGIEFTETMKGFWSQGAPDFETGSRLGSERGNSIQFTVTIRTDNVDRMVDDAAHQAPLAGTVIAPALSPNPLAIVDGQFNLFVENPNQVETRNMRYRMTLVSTEGARWYFDGFKVIRTGEVTQTWHDSSTLYTTIRKENPTGEIIGLGILHIEPADFARQITTMQVLNAQSVEQRLKTAARFGSFFAGTLFESYGGIFARPTAFDPNAPPRKRRPLRAGAPVVYPFLAKDGVPLRLTRYQGGAKGPVILSHGLGVSSLIFSLDTVETNMLEYLYASGYDVWLLDYRASIALPEQAVLQSSGDDVALNDYPAAVDQVRAITGAADVQMVVHCWGSTTFFMAMLAGLQGVRSVVASQIATEVRTPIATRIKTGLHLPTFLQDIGVHTLTAFASTTENLIEKVYDGALRLYPTAASERCQNLTCHRITFMYAPLYNHSQLNELTHETLYETFGVANIKAFQHLALLTNKGHLLNFEGQDVYMPHLDRLAVPITFIHGADNECFVPESTKLTYNALCQANGTALYDRHVIPGYGHIDCIFGKNAANDVYPLVLNALDQHQRA